MAERKKNSSNYEHETYLVNRCPLNKSVDIIKKRWIVQLLLGLNKGNNRFSQLKSSIEHMSDFMLGKNLKFLINEGILTKIKSADTDLGTYYEFTGKGQELMVVLQDMLAWGKKHKL
jgi:DNA-binding HxlR family transcriptional regulator